MTKKTNNNIKCEICGEPNSIMFSKTGQYLCYKHYKQAYRKFKAEENKVLNINSNTIIENGIPKESRKGKLKSENRFYEFEDKNILAIKHNNSIMITDLDKKDLLDHKTWYPNFEGYPLTTVSINGSDFEVRLPRLIAHCTDSNLEVDHKNGILADNRSCNLRICNRSENEYNKLHEDGSRRGINVKYVKRSGEPSYVANITKTDKKGIKKTITKTFDTYEEVVKQREKWEDEYAGEFSAVKSRVNDGVYDDIVVDIRSKKPAVYFEDKNLQQRYYFTDDGNSISDAEN